MKCPRKGSSFSPLRIEIDNDSYNRSDDDWMKYLSLFLLNLYWGTRNQLFTSSRSVNIQKLFEFILRKTKYIW